MEGAEPHKTTSGNPATDRVIPGDAGTLPVVATSSRCWQTVCGRGPTDGFMIPPRIDQTSNDGGLRLYDCRW